MTRSSLLRCLAASAAAFCLTISAHGQETHKPVLYLIGDSTVKNSTNGQVGWGTPLPGHFDLTRIDVENRALGGRSSRSYLREGLWDKVLETLKPGDFVLMQFGHNDGGPMDEGRARASIKGNGDGTKDVTIKETGAMETVHSYGWYLRKYIAETKAKGATPIVCSPVPRNMWTDGKVNRASADYGKWAREAAEQGGALFVDLNGIIASCYEAEGEEIVSKDYFDAKDHTHTLPPGAVVNARAVVTGIRALTECALRDFLKKE